VGLLLGCAFDGIKWWKVLLIGLFLSVGIEALQFFLKKGFPEVDDVIHNTLGCMIGYGVYSIAKLGYEKMSKRRAGVL